MKLRAPSGTIVEIPISANHEPLEAWLRRGWSLLETATPTPEAGMTPISGTPPLPAPVAVTHGQDDVATSVESA